MAENAQATKNRLDLLAVVAAGAASIVVAIAGFEYKRLVDDHAELAAMVSRIMIDVQSNMKHAQMHDRNVEYWRRVIEANRQDVRDCLAGLKTLEAINKSQ